MSADAASASADGASEKPQTRKRKIVPYKNIRAHANPLADNSEVPYPVSPEHMDWSRLFPRADFSSSAVDFADVGCGYGGLTVALGKTFPQKMTIGIEIRSKVSEYVDQRIEELREQNEDGTPQSPFYNIAVERVNAMKHLPNFFKKHQLEKIFFLFPDPHFKKANHRRRIINSTLLSEYAYIVRPGGIAYTVTDVEDLHKWMVRHFDGHPLFRRLSDDELRGDPCIDLILNSSEESRKVDRVQGAKHVAVYLRIEA